MILLSSEVQTIFKNHIVSTYQVQSIQSIFNNVRKLNSINFAPYYQRNYVWDEAKASFFIESILLGTEIPPLVFFNNSQKIEVIDGRQRFETIKRFLEGDFKLSKTGLTITKKFGGKFFRDLPNDVQEMVWDTKLRIIDFSLVNEPKLDEIKEDLIKKEIFRRYNSGITPLKSYEIQRARYSDHDLTKGFKKFLKNNKRTAENFERLFYIKQGSESNDIQHEERMIDKIRFLISLPKIPIKYFSGGGKQLDKINAIFNQISDQNTDDLDSVIKDFELKFEILNEITSDFFHYENVTANRLLNEGFFLANKYFK